MKEDTAKGEDVQIGMLLKCNGFVTGYATVLDKKLDWDTGKVDNEYYEWWCIKVIDGDGVVFWFELDEHDVFIVK